MNPDKRKSVSDLVGPLFGELLNALAEQLNRLLVAGAAHNVLQELQHALVVLRLSLRLHQGNLLHLTLETVVFKFKFFVFIYLEKGGRERSNSILVAVEKPLSPQQQQTNNINIHNIENNNTRKYKVV